MKTKTKLGQSILGFVFAFIMLAALAVGLTRIWAWFNINLGVRQVKYQESRIAAATPEPYDEQNLNKYLAARPVEGYTPLDLTEDWIFKGEYKGDKYAFPGSGTFPGSLDPESACKNECALVGAPSNYPNCSCVYGCWENEWEEIECGCDPRGDTTFSPECCFKTCMCRRQLDPQRAMYTDQAAALDATRDSMNTQAGTMETAAEPCKDPWQKCWWGTFGLVTRKLNQAARTLRTQATSSDTQARKLETIRDTTLACCEQYKSVVTIFDEVRDTCLDEIVTGRCGEIKAGHIAQWDADRQRLIDEGNLAWDIAQTIATGIWPPTVEQPNNPFYCGQYGQIMANWLGCQNPTQCAAWKQTFLSECCNSFVSHSDPDPNNLQSCFAVLDPAYHGYTKACKKWESPGTWGDGCIQTWNEHVPRKWWRWDFYWFAWRECCSKPCWGAPAKDDTSSWSFRDCVLSTEPCDEDCEEAPGKTLPAGCPGPSDPHPKCGLFILQAREAAHVVQLALKLAGDYYFIKKQAINQCCEDPSQTEERIHNMSCGTHKIWCAGDSQADPPRPSRCCYEIYDPGTTSWKEECTEGISHSACQIQCMNAADKIGVSQAAPPSLLDTCQNVTCPASAYPDPEDWDDRETCIKNCLGVDETCYDNCQTTYGNRDPGNFQKCIQCCKDPTAPGCT